MCNDRKDMAIMREERINFIWLVGRDTICLVSRTFNATHKTRITNDTMAKLSTGNNIKRTVSVADARISRCLRTQTGDTLTQVLSSEEKFDRRDPTSLFANVNPPKECDAPFAG